MGVSFGPTQKQNGTVAIYKLAGCRHGEQNGQFTLGAFELTSPGKTRPAASSPFVRGVKSIHIRYLSRSIDTRV